MPNYFLMDEEVKILGRLEHGGTVEATDMLAAVIGLLDDGLIEVGPAKHNINSILERIRLTKIGRKEIKRYA